MFDTRFETKYGVRMSDFEISLARDIVAEIEKLALTACHMCQINRRNLLSEKPNFSRAQRNISRINTLLYQADWAADSLHERYLIQFSRIDIDNKNNNELPDYDTSEQSILDRRAMHLWLEADSFIDKAKRDLENARARDSAHTKSKT